MGDCVLFFVVVLFGKMKFMLFMYGLIVMEVYDKGVMYSFVVLDIINEIFEKKFMFGVV